MPTEQQPYTIDVIEIGNGRYRLHIPATSVEADDPAELLAQIARKETEWEGAIAAAKEQAERIMMSCVEQQLAPHRDVLKRLVKKCPPPQEWFEEPDWTEIEREP